MSFKGMPLVTSLFSTRSPFSKALPPPCHATVDQHTASMRHLNHNKQCLHLKHSFWPSLRRLPLPFMCPHHLPKQSFLTLSLWPQSSLVCLFFFPFSHAVVNCQDVSSSSTTHIKKGSQAQQHTCDPRTGERRQADARHSLASQPSLLRSCRLVRNSVPRKQGGQHPRNKSQGCPLAPTITCTLAYTLGAYVCICSVMTHTVPRKIESYGKGCRQMPPICPMPLVIL